MGTGAFAWVYEAVDLDLEIPIALKVLRPEFAGRLDAETRFRREATTAARLRHPNIVTVRDVGVSEGVVFVAMDLLPLSLARRLDILARIPETEVVRIGLDVASALAIAHSEGVVHRDIKPDNVLLSTSGDAIVADFGLARALSGDPSMSEANQVMGTPHYFSPEQARGKQIDGRTDLYSLGVTLYRAATGQLPFEGDDWYAVARQHIDTPVIPPREIVPELTPEFEAVIMKMLAKRPEDRYENATQLADALMVLPTAPIRRGSGTPITGSATTQIRTLADLRKSKRRYRILGVFLLLLGISVVAGWQLTVQYEKDRLAQAQVTSDSIRKAQLDSANAATKAQVVRDSIAEAIRLAQQAVIDSANAVTKVPVVTAPPKPAATRNGHLELTAPDSAQIFLDDLQIGTGKYSNDLVAQKPLKLRASIRTDVVPCPSASKDTTVTLRPGLTTRVHVPVAACGILTFTMDQPEARFRLNNATFDTSGNNPGKPISIILPRGKYNLVVQASRCTKYEDSVIVTRNPTTQSDTVPRKVGLMCPAP